MNIVCNSSTTGTQLIEYYFCRKKIMNIISGIISKHNLNNSIHDVNSIFFHHFGP